MHHLPIIYFGLFLLIAFLLTLILSFKTAVGKKTLYSQLSILIVIYFVLNLPAFAVGLFFSLLLIGILYEIFNCLEHYNSSINWLPIKIISYALLPFIPILFVYKPVLVFVIVTCYWLLCATYWTMNHKISEAITEIMGIQLVLFSILPISLYPLLSSLYPQGGSLCLFVFFLANSCDLAALLGGKIFGKRLLVPQISPKKTIAGALIALITAITLSYLFIFILKLSFSIYQALFIGLLIGIFAQIGDLFASIFKRFLSIKDYGHLIPGHGGILDRMDSSLFTVPLFMTLLILFDYQ